MSIIVPRVHKFTYFSYAGHVIHVNEGAIQITNPYRQKPLLINYIRGVFISPLPCPVAIGAGCHCIWMTEL